MRGLSTFVIIVLVLLGFGALLWSNARTDAYVAVVPTQVEPTIPINILPTILREGFGDQSTPLPTVAVPLEEYNPPTLQQQIGPSATSFSAVELSSRELFTLPPVIQGASPTPPPPTPLPITGDGEGITVQTVPTDQVIWSPPPLPVPLSRDPLGRDHYWFERPVDSNANNSALRSYTYGADGFSQTNPSRIHHGIDMSNRIGETVRAAGAGVVYYAHSAETPYFQNTPSYGNAVVIEHYAGFNGQVIYTLYAHMERVLVETGQTVEAGQPIGLIGDTGQVTGPHLHFEVRLGGNHFGDTVNPVLWVAPYVGHGTIAGLLTDDRGRLLEDWDVTLRDVRTGTVQGTTTTYIFDDTVNQVNSDPNYHENFVFGDIPVGLYRLIINYEGLRVTQTVQVFEGMTTFVEISPLIPATAQPVTQEP